MVAPGIVIYSGPGAKLASFACAHLPKHRPVAQKVRAPGPASDKRGNRGQKGLRQAIPNILLLHLLGTPDINTIPFLLNPSPAQARKSVVKHSILPSLFLVPPFCTLRNNLPAIAQFTSRKQLHFFSNRTRTLPEQFLGNQHGVSDSATHGHDTQQHLQYTFRRFVLLEPKHWHRERPIVKGQILLYLVT